MSKYLLMRLALNFFELLACLTGFFYWNKIKNTYWKWFPVYLGAIVLTEAAAEIAIYCFKNSELNLALYLYWGIPIQFVFFCWLFSKSLKPFNKEVWPLAGLGIYLASLISENIFSIEIDRWFLSLSYTVGIVILLVLVIIYFIQFANSKDIFQYKRSMMLWVCIGIVAFYPATMPYYGLRNTLYENNKSLFFSYMYVSFALDCLMYLFFAIAFIWSKPK